MESSLERLKKILSPFFLIGNKEEKYFDINELNSFKIELEKLRNKRDEEIDQYISQYTNSLNNFYSGYEHMIRRDLKQVYIPQERKLENLIKILENSEILKLLVLKKEAQKKLKNEQRLLELQIENIKVELKEIQLELLTFKYEYNENNEIVNLDVCQNLYKKYNKNNNMIYSISKKIKQIKDILEIIKLTEEEKEIIDEYKKNIESMTDIEKNRIENVINSINLVELELKIQDVGEDDLQNQMYSQISTNQNIKDSNKPIPPIQNEYTDEKLNDLITTIFNDVINTTKDMKSFKINQSYTISKKNKKKSNKNLNLLELDKSFSDELIEINGISFNKDDFYQAVYNYKNKTKNQKYVVKEIKKIISISLEKMKKVKDTLRDCCAIKLLRDKNIDSFELVRVYGKEKVEEYINEATNLEKEFVTVESSKITSDEVEKSLSYNSQDGEYIFRDDLILSLSSLFKEQFSNWIKIISERLEEKESNNINEYIELNKVKV